MFAAHHHPTQYLQRLFQFLAQEPIHQTLAYQYAVQFQELQFITLPMEVTQKQAAQG